MCGLLIRLAGSSDSTADGAMTLADQLEAAQSKAKSAIALWAPMVQAPSVWDQVSPGVVEDVMKRAEDAK